MAKLKVSLWTIYVLIVQLQTILSFNLDINIPIVKSGNPDSYFGYSVAQHILTEDTYSESEPKLKHVLLVGAPKDNVTLSSAPHVVRSIVRPGAVHKCIFSSRNEDCEQLALMIDEPLTYFRGSLAEDRSDQWLGVSVTSTRTTHGQALACAHRWRKLENHHRTTPSAIWGPGICVSMYNSLDQDAIFDVCGDKSFERGHQDYGFCQAGTSVSASKENDVLIGAPGAMTWRGMVGKTKLFTSLGDDWNMYLNNHVDYTPPIQSVLPDTEYHSYLGMSTAIGRLISNETTYVSGAPRSRETGQVFLFKQGTSGLDKLFVLSGDQLWSNFGYSLAIEDLNGDGFHDLIVGAPTYFKQGISGAIYVYISGPIGITDEIKPIFIPNRKMNSFECKLLDCSNTWFGLAITGTGDLNQDGFNDLAVGAPFEGDGVVYIFHGEESGINIEYAQRIEAADLKTAQPLTTFGYSLSGGIDMDNNSYPDVVVGAYKSDKVVVLRARPIINVTLEINSVPKVIDPSHVGHCSSSGTDMDCFELKFCFKFTAKPKYDFQSGIILDYRIEADTFIAQPSKSRVAFKGADSNNEHVITQSSHLHPQSAKRCKAEHHKFYIRNGSRNFLTPIAFRLTYKLTAQAPPVMVNGGPIPDINSFPILNENGAAVVHTIELKTNCSDIQNHLLPPNCVLDILSYSNCDVALCYMQLDMKFILNSSPEDGDTYILHVGEDHEPTLDITITNDNEDIYGTYLSVTLPDGLDYTGIHNTDDQAVSCHLNGQSNERTIVCYLGNPIAGKDIVKFQIRLIVTIATSTIFKVQITLNTTNDEINLENNLNVLKINAVVEHDIKINGTSIPSYIYLNSAYIGIVIGSIMTGVFLLSIIIVLLWKCGFFNRRKLEDMQKLVASAEREDSTNIETTDGPMETTHQSDTSEDTSSPMRSTSAHHGNTVTKGNLSQEKERHTNRAEKSQDNVLNEMIQDTDIKNQSTSPIQNNASEIALGLSFMTDLQDDESGASCMSSSHSNSYQTSNPPPITDCEKHSASNSRNSSTGSTNDVSIQDDGVDTMHDVIYMSVEL